jgi:hypothetical protein
MLNGDAMLTQPARTRRAYDLLKSLDVWGDKIAALPQQLQIVLKLAEHAPSIADVLAIEIGTPIVPLGPAEVKVIIPNPKGLIFPKDLWIEAEMEHCTRRLARLQEGKIVPNRGPMFWVNGGDPLSAEDIIAQITTALAHDLVP